jgi:hypothetical protein
LFFSTKRRKLYETHFKKCVERDPTPEDITAAVEYCRVQFEDALKMGDAGEHAQDAASPPVYNTTSSTDVDLPVSPQEEYGVYKGVEHGVYPPGSDYTGLSGMPADPHFNLAGGHVNEPAGGNPYYADYQTAGPSYPTYQQHQQYPAYPDPNSYTQAPPQIIPQTSIFPEHFLQSDEEIAHELQMAQLRPDRRVRVAVSSH